MTALLTTSKICQQRQALVTMRGRLTTSDDGLAWRHSPGDGERGIFSRSECEPKDFGRHRAQGRLVSCLVVIARLNANASRGRAVDRIARRPMRPFPSEPPRGALVCPAAWLAILAVAWRNGVGLCWEATRQGITKPKGASMAPRCLGGHPARAAFLSPLPIERPSHALENPPWPLYSG
jgi:hypothetical protein